MIYEKVTATVDHKFATAGGPRPAYMAKADEGNCRAVPFVTALLEGPMKRIPLTLAALMLVSVAGCSGMNSTQQRMLSGGAIGAAGGAALGAVAGGSIVGGALIGGAVGAGAGYIIDQNRRD
jgi:osmotically inducible lipoprotein OsmB